MARKTKTVEPKPEPTLEEKIADATRWAWSVRDRWTNEIELVGNRVAKYTATIAEDPTRLNSCDGLFEYAARLQVFRRIDAALKRIGEPDSETTIASVIEYVRDEALRGARYPTHSTSVSCSLYEQYATKAWAESLEYLTWIANADAKLTELQASAIPVLPS